MEQKPFESRSKLSLDKILSEIQEIEDNYGEPDRLWSMGDIDALLGIEPSPEKEPKTENKPADNYSDLLGDLDYLEDKYSDFAPAQYEQPQPPVEEPFVAEPIVEEPIIEEPIIEEPVAAEEPDVAQIVEAPPFMVNPFAFEPVAEEPVVTESVEAQPFAVNPFAFEPVDEESLETEAKAPAAFEEEQPTAVEPDVAEDTADEPEIEFLDEAESVAVEQPLVDDQPFKVVEPTENIEYVAVKKADEKTVIIPIISPDNPEVASKLEAFDEAPTAVIELAQQPESSEQAEIMEDIPVQQESEDEKKPTVEELFPAPSLKYFADEDVENFDSSNNKGLQGLFGDEVDEDVFKKLNSTTVEVPKENETTEYKNKFIQIIDQNKGRNTAAETIEKPGIILKRGPLSETSGLEPLPQVIPADEFVIDDEEATRVIGTPAFTNPQPPAENVQDEQLVFSGFNNDDQPDKISEEELAAELEKKRAEKKKKFVLLSKFDDDDDDYDDYEDAGSYDYDDGENISSLSDEESEDEYDAPSNNSRPSFEYEKPEQRGKIYSVLKNSLSQSKTAVIGLGVINAIAIVLMLVPKLFEALAIDAPAFDTGGFGLAIANIIVLFAASYLALPAIVSGFKALFTGKVTCETACALTVPLALLHAILMCFNKEPAGAANYFFSAASIFALLLNTEGRRNDMQRMINNFDFCAFKNDASLYAIRAIENEKDAFEVGRGLKMGNPEILYSGKIMFPENFIANSRACSTAGVCAKRNLIISAAASALLAIVTGIVTKDFFQAVSALVGGFCLTAPVSILLSLAIPLRIENKKLNRIGAMVASYDAAETCSSAVAAAVDSADLFNRAACEMHGMKDYKTVRIDDVLLYATAIVLKSGGPLSGVFNGIIGGSTDILPPVKDMLYEDRLGISATIYGQRVLFGNRNLLVHHNIDVPPKAEEDKYKLSGRKVIYIAIDSKVAAMFVIKYVEDDTLCESLGELEINGFNLVVRTDDPNVTDEMLASKFGIASKSIKITHSGGAQVFRSYRDSVMPSAQTGILHDGSALSYFKSIAACNRLSNYSLKYSMFAMISQAIVAAGAFISIVLGAPALISPIATMVVQSIIVGASVFVEKHKLG